MTDAEEFRKTLLTLHAQLDDLQNFCQPMSELTPAQLANLLPADGAELNCSMAYSIHALLWVYFKSVGMNDKTQHVKKELDKVQVYFKKIRDQNKEPEKPTMQLNKDAAKKLIIAELGGMNNINAQNERQNKISPKKRTKNPNSPSVPQKKQKH